MNYSRCEGKKLKLFISVVLQESTEFERIAEIENTKTKIAETLSKDGYKYVIQEVDE